jgi:hypothetical protein
MSENIISKIFDKLINFLLFFLLINYSILTIIIIFIKFRFLLTFLIHLNAIRYFHLENHFEGM